MDDILAALTAQGVNIDTVLAELEAERDRRVSENRLKHYKPYQKQRDFHAAGATFRERLFIAGNQLGKSLSSSAEDAMHLTGRYPDWWTGHRYKGPITLWASGVTRETTRDGLQRLLLGRAGAHGTGMIPKDCILNTMSAQGVADAVAIARIKHESGLGVSTLIFKSYDMGREKWQGDTVHKVSFDEEPPIDIYTEGMTRTNAVPDGRVSLVFTPLLGMSEVVRRFLLDKSPDRNVTTMTIDDAEHYTQEQRDRIIASYQDWERDARTRGVPTMGSGRIYPVNEDMLKEEGQKIPDHWAKIAGMDFGWDHPTTAVWLAWDRDADVVHIYDVYKLAQATPVVHAAAMKARGAKIPMAWPHDGLQHDKGSGEQLAELYRKQGVAMLPERAQFADDRGSGVEAGVLDILDRMQTGRLKVARHLGDWFEEFRLYHREDGKIVKEYDDVMDAMRYAMMSLRFAKATGSKPRDPYARQSNSGPTSYMAA